VRNRVEDKQREIERKTNKERDREKERGERVKK
jgi:hypothetical protein